jgi:eukaryotic-like serine/threonine-protein kinase
MSPDPRSTALPSPPELSASSPGEHPADALTRLLEELARTPEALLVETWQHQLAPGEVVGRFELVRVLGRGGFGVVYEARDRELQRLVAFKALRPGRALDAKQADALRREAEAAAKLNHPNVVTVHDFGTCPAGPYLILELLRGDPLSRRLERGPLPPHEAVRIASGVAQALVHAHGAGVVHRDLKPGNVFLGQGGSVKVLDFGLARILGVGGAQGGTPGYMAPEQCRGEPEDERTDLFGLGVLLFRMLTGAMPFAVVAGRSAVLDGSAPPVPRGKGIPPRLSSLVGRLLAGDPELRPRTALEVVDEFDRVARELDPARLARRRRSRLALVALALLAAGGGAAAGLWLRLSSARSLEHMTVAVADFANETGDPQLDGLSGLLITSLEQSRKLSVLTRSRMRDELRKLGHDEVARVDESLAREVGRATGANALFLASMKRLGDAYAVEVRVLDPATDSYLFTLREGADRKEDVPALIDRLSERARSALRERGDDIRGHRVEMGAAVTRNLEAYQHYFRGLECIERPGDAFEPEVCSAHFREAVKDDPAFALAHYRLAYLASTIQHDGVPRDRAFVEAELGAALRGASDLPARERSLILALKAHVDGDDEGAMARYRELVARFPDDKHAQFLAAELLLARDDRAGALPFIQAAATVDPFFQSAVRQLVHALGALRRYDELRAQLATWSRLPPNAALRGAVVRGAVWLGDLDGALAAALANVAAAPSADTYTDLANVQFSRGEFRATEGTLREALRAAPGDERVRYYLADAVSAQGRHREAGRLQEAVDREVRRAPWDAAMHRAHLLGGSEPAAALWADAAVVQEHDVMQAATLAPDLALAGDVAHARELAARLPARTVDGELASAALAWRAGDSAQATARLKALDALAPLPPWGMPPSLLLACVASATGDDVEVLEAVQRFRTLWSHLGLRGGWDVPRALFLEAKSLARLGRTDAARGRLDALLAEWAAADAGEPLVAEARSLRASLDILSAPRR